MATSRYAAAHVDPQGPGDARPTTDEVIKDEGAIEGMAGKVILITGGTSGLGKESARALYETGAKIFITARQMERGKQVAEELSTSQSRPPISVIEMSLDSLASVRAGAAAFISQSKMLNILMTNAGVMASPEGRTQDGFETQFGVNHLAHLLLFKLLQPTLIASSTPAFNSRVIALSSSGHRISGIHFDNLNLKGEYNPWVAYGQSKTANIYFANEITRRYGSKGVQGLSVHPGAVPGSELSRHVEGDEWFLEKVRNDPAFKLQGKSLEQGAATQVWAAVAKELEGKGGLYLDNVSVSKPFPEEGSAFHPGYAPHAYDEAKEKQLYTESLKLIGLDDED